MSEEPVFMREILMASLVLAAGPAAAQPSLPAAATGQTAQGEVAVTIYNDNLALVQDRRRLTLPSGRHARSFPTSPARSAPRP
jgi:hypothetical protein